MCRNKLTHLCHWQSLTSMLQGTSSAPKAEPRGLRALCANKKTKFRKGQPLPKATQYVPAQSKSLVPLGHVPTRSQGRVKRIQSTVALAIPETPCPLLYQGWGGTRLALIRSNYR